MSEELKRPNRVVIALGGNSLGNSAEEEMDAINKAVPFLIELAKMGNEIIITHGNGPQVGMFQNAMRIAHQMAGRFPLIDLTDSVAITQGFIGYHLQQGLVNEIIRQNLPWHVATIITRIEVDKDDPAFTDPEKPIGAFFTPSQVMDMVKEDPSLQFMEDSGRGCRRAVASPEPKRILEAASILNLIDNDFIAIACGGGGIPVAKQEDGTYQSIPCVLDKDLASELLAEDCDAEMLILLTGVEYVSINFGRPDQEDLKNLSVADAERFLAEGQFGKGSMEPKVKAAIRFVKSKPGRVAIIGKLDKAPEAFKGQSGTRFIGPS